MSKLSVKETHKININENTVCDIDFLAIVKISGEDAQAFLQGQFSNDANALKNLQSQWNSYNSPKGRLYATFRLCKIDQNFFLLLPKEVVDQVVKRLRMFVLRSKVTLENISNNWKVLGFAGNELPPSAPKTLNDISQSDNTFWINIPSVIPRIMCFGENNTMDELTQQWSEKLALVDGNHWRRLDIHSGIANIFAATQEEFVAQMVNLQLTDGVSFTKGCYPGQEVVARMHYLGKLKKRMFRITIHAHELPKLGEHIYDIESNNQQSIGQIVDAQRNNTGNLDALTILQIANAESHGLRVASTDGAKISVETLPYSFD